MCKKAQSFWLGWLLAHPGSSLIPGFPGKAWKIKWKFPRFPGFSLCAKKPGASDWNDFWHILAFPWFLGFLESLEKPRENLPHGTLGSSLIAGLPRKPGEANRRFSTLHSWLLLDYGVSWKAWKSQEKTLMKSHIVTVLDCFKSVTTFLAKTNTNKYFLHKYRLLLSHIVPVLDYDKYFNVYFTSF